MHDRILTSEQVAEILQVHPFTVLKYIKQGKLKGSKLGRMYRIRESDVEQFLNKQASASEKATTSTKTQEPKSAPKPAASLSQQNQAQVSSADRTDSNNLPDHVDHNFMLE